MLINAGRVVILLLCLHSDALVLVVSCLCWRLGLELGFIVSYTERLCRARLSDHRQQERFCPLSLAGLISHARAAPHTICGLGSELPGSHPSFFSAEKPTPDKRCPYAYIQVSSAQGLLNCSVSAPDHALSVLPVVQTGPSCANWSQFLALSSCCCLDPTCENLERDFERLSQTQRGCLWNTTRKTCRLSMATCSSSSKE